MTAKRITGDMDAPNLPSMTEILPSDINERVEAQGILDTERHLLQMNEEEPANDYRDTARLIGNISPTPIVINGFLGNKDLFDFYKFTVPPNNQNKINVTLSGLKEVVWLSFFTKDSNTSYFGRAEAKAGSDASVTIPENLQPGDYGVNLEWRGVSDVLWSPYTLTLKGDSNATPSISTIAFSEANYTVNENGTKATITFKRNGPTGGDIRGSLKVESGTATPVEDYDFGYSYSSFGSAFIPADKDFEVIEIPIVNDNKQEGDETIKLSLTNGGMINSPIGAPATATLTIKDDDSGMPITTPTPVGMP
ncbi:Calx-beta domain-containing protein, partial [Microcoleus sp. S13_B4]|uniref:Calx-beta domain-containing protein n=1 Tax=Microcoleus sp. S13_B4 TaxID=3055408 RepID=UPI002FD21E23